MKNIQRPTRVPTAKDLAQVTRIVRNPAEAPVCQYCQGDCGGCF